jgi:hypothetical protein
MVHRANLKTELEAEQKKMRITSLKQGEYVPGGSISCRLKDNAGRTRALEYFMHERPDWENSESFTGSKEEAVVEEVEEVEAVDKVEVEVCVLYVVLWIRESETIVHSRKRAGISERPT